jgi:hypothetical protein
MILSADARLILGADVDVVPDRFERTTRLSTTGWCPVIQSTHRGTCDGTRTTTTSHSAAPAYAHFEASPVARLGDGRRGFAYTPTAIISATRQAAGGGALRIRRYPTPGSAPSSARPMRSEPASRRLPRSAPVFARRPRARFSGRGARSTPSRCGPSRSRVTSWVCAAGLPAASRTTSPRT